MYNKFTCITLKHQPDVGRMCLILLFDEYYFAELEKTIAILRERFLLNGLVATDIGNYRTIREQLSWIGYKIFNSASALRYCSLLQNTLSTFYASFFRTTYHLTYLNNKMLFLFIDFRILKDLIFFLN